MSKLPPARVVLQLSQGEGPGVLGPEQLGEVITKTFIDSVGHVRDSQVMGAWRPAGAVESVTGRRPELSTTGGTSDARFIKDVCPVAEFGLVGQTMHQINERVPVADLEMLAKIYATFLSNYFDTAGDAGA